MGTVPSCSFRLPKGVTVEISSPSEGRVVAEIFDNGVWKEALLLHPWKADVVARMVPLLEAHCYVVARPNTTGWTVYLQGKLPGGGPCLSRPRPSPADSYFSDYQYVPPKEDAPEGEEPCSIEELARHCTQHQGDTVSLDLAYQVAKKFAGERVKTATLTREVLPLARIPNKKLFGRLMEAFVTLPEPFSPLAKLVQNADPANLDSDGVTTILNRFFTGLQEIRSREGARDFLHALGGFLDAVAEARIEVAVDQRTLADPILQLQDYRQSSDLFLSSLASYVLQSLLWLPNGMAKQQSPLRRVVQTIQVANPLARVTWEREVHRLENAWQGIRPAFWHRQLRELRAFIDTHDLKGFVTHMALLQEAEQESVVTVQCFYLLLYLIETHPEVMEESKTLLFKHYDLLKEGALAELLLWASHPEERIREGIRDLLRQIKSLNSPLSSKIPSEWPAVATAGSLLQTVLVEGASIPIRPSDNPIHLPPLHPPLILRKIPLQILTERLLSTEAWSAEMPSRIVTIFGPSGVGKRNLAVQAALQLVPNVSLIWFIHAERDYRCLAKFLQVDVEKTSYEELVEKVHRRLEQGLAKPYLLIFSDVNTLPKLPAKGGSIILTTCNSTLVAEADVTLAPFIDEEAISLTKQIIAKPSPETKVRELNKILEGLPYLLVPALHDINNSTLVSFTAYLRELGESKEGVITKITLRLQEESPLAHAFLQICAYLDPDHIPLSLLGHWLKQQGGKSQRQIVKALTTSSLVALDTEGHSLSLHSQVQSSLRQGQGIFKQALELLSSWTKGFEEEDPEGLVVAESALVHFEALRQNPLWEEADAAAKNTLLLETGKWLRIQHRPIEALRYAEESLELSNQLYANNFPDRASSLCNIANCYQAQGDYRKALDLHQRALVIRKEVLGADHPDVATSLYCMAECYKALGQRDRSLSLHEEALAIRRLRLTGLNLTLATSLWSAGKGSYSQGNYAKALPQLEEAYAIRRALLGDENLFVIATLYGVALCCKAQGSLDRALSLHTQVFDRKSSILGATHTDTAASLHSLASCYKAKGKYEKALKLHERALQIRREALGNAHPDTTESVTLLANFYRSRGKIDKALELHKEALALRRTAPAEHRLAVAESLSDIAFCHALQKDYSAALAPYEEALEIRRAVLKNDHLDVAASLIDVANCHKSLKQQDQALKKYEEALAIQREALGDRHIDVAATLNNAASCHKSLKQHSLALKGYEEALKIEEAAEGDNRSSIAASLNGAAGCYRSLKQYDRAIEFYERARNIGSAVSGRDRANVATHLHNLALCHHLKGSYAAAAALYEEALKMQKAAVEEEANLTVATILHSLASCYKDMKNYDQALKANEEALAIRKEKLGGEHPDVASSLCSIANCYQAKEDYPTALQWHKEALAIEEKAGEASRAEAATSLYNMGNCCRLLEQYEEALGFYDRAFVIRKELTGESNADMATLLHQMALCSESLQDYTTALERYNQMVVIKKAVLGETHPEVVAGLREMARCYEFLDQFDGVLQCHENVLEILEKTTEKASPDRATGLYNVANCYYLLGNYDKALQRHNEALNIRKIALPSPHLAVAESLIGIATCSQSNLTAALQNCREALEILQSLGESPEVEPILKSLIALYEKLNGSEIS